MKSKRDRLPYTSARGPLFRLGGVASGILFTGSAATAGGSDGEEPVSAGAAQAHVGFPADDEVVRIHFLLGRGDAILLLGLPAGSLDGAGYELALGVELRELEPHALHADAELRREGLDAPRGGVGRHEGEHALAQRQACHGSIPYLSHLAMSASSTL